jgi:putative FmdB family regulatory protein
MPLYTFLCNTCEKEVSLFLSLKELRRNKACPECKGGDLTGPMENEASRSGSDTQVACSLSKKS